MNNNLDQQSPTFLVLWTGGGGGRGKGMALCLHPSLAQMELRLLACSPRPPPIVRSNSQWVAAQYRATDQGLRTLI